MTIPAPKEGRPRQQFGFVHFSERAPVVKLLEEAAKGVKPELDGNAIEVEPFVIFPLFACTFLEYWLCALRLSKCHMVQWMLVRCLCWCFNHT